MLWKVFRYFSSSLPRPAMRRIMTPLKRRRRIPKRDPPSRRDDGTKDYFLAGAAGFASLAPAAGAAGLAPAGAAPLAPAAGAAPSAPSSGFLPLAMTSGSAA